MLVLPTGTSRNHPYFLRTARSNPKMLAYQALEGKFDYNVTPLAPSRTKSLIYEAPSKRTAWGPHVIDGWYLGPAMKHYRCGRYFIPLHTRHTHMGQIQQAFSNALQYSTISEADRTLLVAAEMITLLNTSMSLSMAEKLVTQNPGGTHHHSEK